jgi:quercetin dioxygenase-like cupin family protein
MNRAGLKLETMMVTKSRFVILLGTAAFVAGFAVAQTMSKTAREPQFENTEVKVWKSVVLPNDPLPLHRHEHPRVIIALAGGTMKILEDSSQSEIHQWQTGKAYWLPSNPPGTLHQDINIGDKPIEVIVVELQNAK